MTHIRIQCRKVKHLQIYKLTKIVDKRKFYKNITKVSYKNENSQKKIFKIAPLRENFLRKPMFFIWVPNISPSGISKKQ